MPHIILSSDLDGYEATRVIAASSEERKRLLIVSVIKNGKVKSNFEVTVKGEAMASFDNLDRAIEKYNSI